MVMARLRCVGRATLLTTPTAMGTVIMVMGMAMGITIELPD